MRALEYFNQSTTALFINDEGQLYRTEDEGGKWKSIKLKKRPKLDGTSPIIKHPYDNNVAIIITDSQDHLITKDQGKNWKTFQIAEGQAFEVLFNAQRPDLVLANVYDKSGQYQVFYTTDMFKSNGIKIKNEDVKQCTWAFGSPSFESSVESSTMVCVYGSDNKLATTADFGKQLEPVKINDKEISHIVGVGSVSSFITGAFAETANEPQLIVTKDLIKWTIASFPQLDSEKGFTILPSSKHSLHVDVADKSGTGTLFTSNSQGTSFRESLRGSSRSHSGLVDIEDIAGIDGILIANVDVDTEGQLLKDRRSKISFDDGRNWEFLRIRNCDKSNDDCYLNLHNALDHRNVGRIFSSPSPGLMAGIGNTGRTLDGREKGDLYVSENSGITWTRALEGPHLFEFGAMGTILVAIPDTVTDAIRLSTDRGRTWSEAKLKTKVQPIILTTNTQSATTSFILIGVDPKKDRTVTITLKLDVWKNACSQPSGSGGNDFEVWYASYDPITDQPSCLMGHKQAFYRKKVDAECLVTSQLKLDLPSEPCSCAESDFECDDGFEWSFNEHKCLPGDKLQQEWAKCQKGETVERSKGYRLIPGDTCSRTDGISLDGKEKVTCKGGDDDFHNNPPNTGEGIKVSQKTIDGSVTDYFYLKADPDYPGQETLMMRNEYAELFVTHNQGFDWETPLPNEEIVELFPNNFFPAIVYCLTSDEKLKVTTDRGHTFKNIALPGKPTPQLKLKFHPDHPNMVIIEGCEDCSGGRCKSHVYYSTRGGEAWQGLGVEMFDCSWIGSRLKQNQHDDQLIFCQQTVETEPPRTGLVSSTDYFRNGVLHLVDTVGYAIEEEFILAAKTDTKNNELLAYASIDGKNFAQARFPANFKIQHQQSYTVLQSVTSSVFLHVTVSDRKGGEYGTILKSNFNGTDYVVTLENVNRNAQGFVDFEKMQGLEGIALANIVLNSKDVSTGGVKKLKTMITHNDGAEWTYVPPPAVDVDGNRYCKSGESLAKCSLNLHAYTERDDYRDSYSSQSAIGLMVAVGNVGEFLTNKEDGNTYLTRDGGVTWKEVKKGNYLWEFGDSGSIIALVQNKQPTNILHYTLDEGQSWQEYKFSDELVTVKDIATTPSDTSRKFVLFASPGPSQGHKSLVISIDFTNLFPRKCIVDSGNDQKDDFELWAPWNPQGTGECLFGHQALYHRKKLDRNCYIGWDPTSKDILRPHVLLRNCSCSRVDYECDYNYYRDNDGTCKLVPGHSPPDHTKACKEDPELVEYWEPTGYRRIPLSTCEGGQELDKSVVHPCPGHHTDFERRHGGLGWVGIVFIILVPLVMGSATAFIVWDHFSKRYGQIRLGDEDNDAQSVVMRYAVVGIAGVIAVASVVPAVVRRIYHRVQEQFFGAPRMRLSQAYVPVDVDDEDSLLNDDGDDIEDAAELEDDEFERGDDE